LWLHRFLKSDIAVTNTGGIHVAAATPHRPDAQTPDLGAALDLIDFLSQAGVDGLALFGSTGEFLHFSNEARARLVYLAVKRSRVPVIAGISHATLNGALQLARDASNAGAAYLLLMPPFFFRYDQAEVREFYLQFMRSVGRSAPVILYNIPAFTSEITVETARELLSTDLFAGIKDSSGKLDYVTELQAMRPERSFLLLVGNDLVFTAGRRAGADGVVSGVACAVPELLVGLNRAILQADEERIQRLDSRLREFISWIEAFPTPVGVKAATALRGVDLGPPAVPLSPETNRRVAEFGEWFRAWLPEVQKEVAVHA
jgi:4-hydroxy-tetrahydrodipicolinate synthase